MSNVYYTDSGNTIHLGSEVSRGGEGIVYHIHSYPSDVAKIYIKPQSAEVHRKILAMVQNPPHDPTVNGPMKHRSIAWPIDILYSDRQKTQFGGFIMPRVDMKIFGKILNYISPDVRRNILMGEFTWVHLCATARNLASCIAAIHDRGYCIGDINESNILVAPFTPLTIIDCDSFQVKDPSSGKVWRCTVGKPEYTAPEILGKKYEDIDRTQETDCFALAILIFQLLMEGFHPYQATGPLVANAPLTHDKIRQGIFAYATSMKGIAPPPDAPSFDILHPEIRALFLRCFDVGHKNPSLRPSAKEWMSVLDKLNHNFQRCSINKNHLYYNHLNSCPWCIRAKNLGEKKDSFPSLAGSQILLPDPRKQVISKQERETLLLPFIEMALMDGYISPEEEAYLIDQGLKLHIPEKNIKKLIANEIQKKGLLTTSGSNPLLNVSKNYIEFKDVKNGASVFETIEISNDGDGIMTGTIASSVQWIKVPTALAPNMKNQFQKINITVDTSGLPYGFSGAGNISIKTNGGNKNITVNLTTEGLSLLLPKFRSRYVPLVASFFGFIFSFNKSPAEGFLYGAIIWGVLTYLFSKIILKFILNRGIDLSKYPPLFIRGATVGFVALSLMTHLKGNPLESIKIPVGTGTPARSPAAPTKLPEHSQIKITRATIAEGLDSNQTPTGINTKFIPGNKTLYYFVNYSGAIPNKTIFDYHWYKNSNQIRNRQQPIVNETGYAWNSFSYNFDPGEYEVRLYVGRQEINRTVFSIEQEQPQKQPQIKITKAVIAEDLDSNNKPLGINTTFYPNARYGNDRRTYVVYYMEYEGAVANKTEVFVKWLKDGQYLGLQQSCRKTLTESSGSYWCKSSGYYLPVGEYEARLLVNGQEIDRAVFNIQQKSQSIEQERHSEPETKTRVSKSPTVPLSTQKSPIDIDSSKNEQKSFAITLQSFPSGATVVIDKKVWGITPFTIVLEEGPHGVGIKKDNYRSQWEIIKVDKESKKEIFFTLEKE